MYRIIQGRGTGKTSNLMLTAKANEAVFVCADPCAMRHKAEAYGIVGIEFISYEDLMDDAPVCENIVIDELENFVKWIITNNKLVGYSLTNED